MEKNHDDKEINDVAYRSITVDHLFLFRIIGILPYVADDEPNISRYNIYSSFFVAIYKVKKKQMRV